MFSLRRLFWRELRKAVRGSKKSATLSTETISRKETVSITSQGAATHYQSISTVQQTTIKGTCWVIDGDTICIGKQKIRLAGVDAPELNNPYGKQAKWAMVELCKGQTITAYLTGETSYDRVVAKCFLEDGRDLAEEIVKAGLALDLPHFPNADYKRFEPPGVRRKLRWRPKQ